jgi:hypothetical protein
MFDALTNLFAELLQQPLFSRVGGVVMLFALIGLILVLAILIGLAVIGLTVLRMAFKNSHCRSLQPIAATVSASAGSNTPRTAIGQNCAISDLRKKQ